MDSGAPSSSRLLFKYALIYSRNAGGLHASLFQDGTVFIEKITKKGTTKSTYKLPDETLIMLIQDYNHLQMVKNKKVTVESNAGATDGTSEEVTACLTDGTQIILNRDRVGERHQYNEQIKEIVDYIAYIVNTLIK